MVDLVYAVCLCLELQKAQQMSWFEDSKFEELVSEDSHVEVIERRGQLNPYLCVEKACVE